MSGTLKTREDPPAVAADDLARRFAGVTFDDNPLTPIKAEALLELYDRQVKMGDRQAVFTLGMIEGFLESQQPDFDIDAATEKVSERIGNIILRRMFGMALKTDGGTTDA